MISDTLILCYLKYQPYYGSMDCARYQTHEYLSYMEQVCTARLRELTADNGFCKMPIYPVINAIHKNSLGHLWSGMELTLKWPPKIGSGCVLFKFCCCF